MTPSSTPLGALLLENTTYVQTQSVIAQTNVTYLPTAGNHPTWTYDGTTGDVAPFPSLTAEEDTLLVAEIEKYNALWTTDFYPYSGVGYPDPLPSNLTLTTEEWLSSNGFEVLPVLFNLGMFVYGYGDPRETPILYSLQFFTPSILATFAGEGTRNMVDFHAVMAQYAETISGPIILNTEISCIDRSKARPVITYSVNGTKSKTQSCTSLILAFPPTVKLLEEANLHLTAAEKDLFSSVQLTNYWSGAVSMDIPAAQGWYANSSNPALPPQPEGQPVGFIRLYNQSDVVTTWSWGASNVSYTNEEAYDLLVSTLSRINYADPSNLTAAAAVPITDDDVKAFRFNEYFPHVSGAELAAGWYQRFAKLQGAHATYYASGLNSFESVEFAFRAGLDVVDNYMGDS
ncbi:FAD/NAD(P)-binding domain-containing protein [Mycena sanguinolenta]|uniref:FAD/NAD(P)-binding domain-containing protein n=1 Tax=Mycena sanguinolenta TaxID=230812 RepID=A0A8H7DB27_9AGAR|nr:FAD/NAD(P)-binding domain-containing protein [Mycena sanguinolenta]